MTSPAAAVLHPPAADPGSTEDERRAIVEMMAKGTHTGMMRIQEVR